MDAQWERNRYAVLTQRTIRGLWTRKIDLLLRFAAIMCLIRARQRRPSSAAEDLIALSRVPHFVSSVRLSENRATAHTQSARRHMTILQGQIKMPLRCCSAVGDSSACTLAFYFFFRNAAGSPLATQPKCDRNFTTRCHCFFVTYWLKSQLDLSVILKLTPK